MNIYIHLPFCVRKCLYCDFYSVAARSFPMRRYTDALIEEFNSHPEAHVKEDYTFYIGGGTPSLLPAGELMRLIGSVTEKKGRPSEFTMEVNPDDVTPELAHIWRETGIDRISMGVQSLENAELKAIGRRHDAETALKAYEVLSNYFDNISLDLMFGLPGQNLESLSRTLDGFISLHPAHISAYSLMYEERSALTRLRDAGRVEETEEDICVDMFTMISERLNASGYRQYEISNYALPGFESRHNSSYWAGTAYLGIGASAHSYDGRRMRSRNVDDYKRYIDYWESPRIKDPYSASVAISEYLDDSELAEEMIMTRLRTRSGLNIKEYGQRFGMGEAVRLVNRAKALIESGMLRREGASLILTKDGIMVSDNVIATLF